MITLVRDLWQPEYRLYDKHTYYVCELISTKQGVWVAKKKGGLLCTSEAYSSTKVLAVPTNRSDLFNLKVSLLRQPGLFQDGVREVKHRTVCFGHIYL